MKRSVVFLHQEVKHGGWRLASVAARMFLITLRADVAFPSMSVVFSVYQCVYTAWSCSIFLNKKSAFGVFVTTQEGTRKLSYIKRFKVETLFINCIYFNTFVHHLQCQCRRQWSGFGPAVTQWDSPVSATSVPDYIHSWSSFSSSTLSNQSLIHLDLKNNNNFTTLEEFSRIAHHRSTEVQHHLSIRMHFSIDMKIIFSTVELRRKRNTTNLGTI